MIPKALHVVLLILVLWPTAIAAQSVPVPGGPLALRERPRVFLNSRTMAEVKSRLATGGVWHNQFQQWVTWADGYRVTATTTTTLLDTHNLPAVYAFIYATYPVSGVTYTLTRTEYGTVARDSLMRLPTLWPSPGTLENGYMAAVAYDWAWGALSSSDRAALVAWFKTTYEGNSAHPFNALQVMGRLALLIEGIVISGDGIDDAWAATQVGNYARFFEEQTGVTRSESDLLGEDGGYSEGDAYANGYSFMGILAAEEAWRTANGVSRTAHYGSPHKSVARRIPLHYVNTILPWAVPYASYPGGRKYVLWKSHYAPANWKAAEPLQQAVMTAMIGAIGEADTDMTGLSQWLIENRIGPVPTGGVYNIRYWPLVFMMGAQTIAKSPTLLNLPVSRGTRDGRYIFRTGYNSLSDSYVTVTFSEWHRGIYSPQYPGGFTMDRKGPQVIRQGGTSGHDPGKFGAGPANILIFPDRSISGPTHPQYDDQGGQRVYGSNLTGSVDFVQNGPNDLRGEMRFLAADLAAGRDVDYVGGDITRAYNSTLYNDGHNPARVSNVVREFLYLRPATPGVDPDLVVVYDRATTTDTKFAKEWLFHTSGDPVIDGTELAGQPVRGGSGLGKWTYTGATRVSATNTTAGSDGRTFLTPLLPASRKIVKVGGPNPAGLFWQADSREFEGPYGDLRPAYSPPDTETAQYVGKYRIEITPTVPSLNDVFLNVIEVTDSTVTTPTATALLASAGIVAARVGNRVAAFNRLGGNVATGELTMDQAGSFKFHFAGLAPNAEYRVTVGSGSPVLHTASTAGTLYLQLSVGSGTRVTVTATGVVAAPPTPNTPTNLRRVP